MVSTDKRESLTRIVLTPNRSLNWRGNQLVILSLLFISSVISIGFALLGAWVILPFAGIEITALAASLYYVSWKLSYCHVLTINEGELMLQKGVRFPKYTCHFPLVDIVLLVERSKHEWDPPAVFIAHQTERIVFGEFLSKLDKKTLLDELRRTPIPLRTVDSHTVKI